MKTALVSLLLVSAFLVALAPAAEAAYKPCTAFTGDCPGLVCKAYDPRTGYRSGCIGEPIYCIAEPCPHHGLP